MDSDGAVCIGVGGRSHEKSSAFCLSAAALFSSSSCPSFSSCRMCYLPHACASVGGGACVCRAVWLWLWLRLRLCVQLNICLNEPQIAYIAHCTLKALCYLHTAKKIFHRDIKGGNLLLTTDGGVKVTDFGISKKMTNTMVGRSLARYSQTFINRFGDRSIRGWIDR